MLDIVQQLVRGIALGCVYGLIALGFVLRVEAGALAIAVEVSSWLLLCTTFVALFLGFAKRRHELALQPQSGTGTRSVLEHYNLTFVDQMINVVTASTMR